MMIDYRFNGETMTIDFKVYGEAVGKQRPRLGKGGHIYTPRKTVDYENLIKEAYTSQYADFKFEKNIPLYVNIRICKTIPKTATKAFRDKARVGEVFPTCKPDIDNVIKSILDALNGVAYCDDSQIVTLETVKRYDCEEFVEIYITRYDQYEGEGVE